MQTLESIRIGVLEAEVEILRRLLCQTNERVVLLQKELEQAQQANRIPRRTKVAKRGIRAASA